MVQMEEDKMNHSILLHIQYKFKIGIKELIDPRMVVSELAEVSAKNSEKG